MDQRIRIRAAGTYAIRQATKAVDRGFKRTSQLRSEFLPRSNNAASAATTLPARILNSDRQIGRCMELNTPNRRINLAGTGDLSRNRGARREWRNG
jgi:hypothetical protein